MAGGRARSPPCCAAAAPSPRTVTAILGRHGRLCPPPATASAPQFFERAALNELRQLDFKGPVEIARRPWFPPVVVDDHSRFQVALRACADLTMATT
jgi:putative transposase